MDYSELGRKVLDETIASLKGEYQAIPQTVKDVMPKAAILIAKGLVGLDDRETADFKHAMAILANVKVGGQIALNQLMLNTAANILAAGVSMLRKMVGL